MQVLEDKGVTAKIENVAGTSSGAIVGTLLSMGYNATEMKDIMYNMKVQRFNDGGWFFIGGQHRLRKHFGWYKGVALERWIGDLIQQKTGNADITFRQLHELALKDKRYKNIYITATNLTRQKLEVFSWQTYPDMCIKTAVRASFSVPLYFEATLLDSNGHEVNKNSVVPCQAYVDGGIVANYPLNIFDNGTPNMETLGLDLVRPEQIDYKRPGLAPYPIHSPIS